MKILMFSNTFIPRLGGVTESIVSLRRELRARGHSVLIVTSGQPDVNEDRKDVVRVPVLARTTGADWPLPIVSGRVRNQIKSFAPEIVHAHHPFLLGRTALHASAWFDVPMVYTFHTRYDLYVRAFGGGIWGERLMRRSMMAFCRIADGVIAPSDSIRSMLEASGLATPVITIPSGIDAARVAGGDRDRTRMALGIGEDTFVVGHIGRLAVEKNLTFLATAIAVFLRNSPSAIFLVGGDGPQRPIMMEHLSDVADRVIFTGALKGRAVADALAAMDVFAFASLTETQGLVVAEAQAAGLPVIALDAPGVREAVTRGRGLLLDHCAAPSAFAETLHSFEKLSEPKRESLRKQALGSAALYSAPTMAKSTEDLYGNLIAAHTGKSPRSALQARIATELRLFISIMSPFDTATGWKERA